MPGHPKGANPIVQLRGATVVPGEKGGPNVIRTAVVAGGLATLGTLPIFLLSAQAVVVRAELGLDEADLGLAASCFFGAAAVATLAGGAFMDRLSGRASTFTAAALSATACLGIAWGVTTLTGLLLLLAVGGLGNALLQGAGNVMLAQAVPPARRGMAYGIKQSAIPVAVITGGLAVPTVGALVGWRWTFTGTAGLCLAVALSALRKAGDRPVLRTTATGPVQRPPRPALLLSAVATMLASGAAVSLGAFLPSWAHRQGLTITEAALLLSVGGALSLAARLGSGFAADRRTGRHMPVVSLHLVVGALGLLLLAVDGRVPLVVGSLVAFGIGWSWPGVLLFALVRVGRDSPGAASGAVQGGNFAGAALGPALFGWLVAGTDYPTAWRAAAVAMLIGGVLLLLARQMFLTDRRLRPPTSETQ